MNMLAATKINFKFTMASVAILSHIPLIKQFIFAVYLKSLTGQVGYVYDVRTAKIQWIEGTDIRGKWEYREFKPHAISNDGTIVGYAGFSSPSGYVENKAFILP